MRLNEVFHGFRVCECKELPEIHAVLWRMRYEKNGADLVWLEREDENKTFSISFKTLPWNDTGIFHILEHSVLNGSEKYPVREPFVELLKSSLQTFLNAMTFPDKTMYPVCSRNNKDFLNLMDVYLDAVFHPLSLRDPHAFRQEGWHYELSDPDGELTCNGVVLNEMKGAYSSPDTILMAELNRRLFPDNCYGYDSGGDPEHITELRYEDYLTGHRKYYHPSNSLIYLDGSIDTDSVFSLLGRYLSEYEQGTMVEAIPLQTAVVNCDDEISYEISDAEADEDRIIFGKSWVCSTFDEKERNIACSLLADILTGENEAPLTKALLDAGLAEDVDMQLNDSMLQNCLTLEVRNIPATQREEVSKTVRECLESCAEKGLDHGRLHAMLNHIEFSLRERDYGGAPKGLVFGIQMMDTWLYGGDPARNFCFDELFPALREKIDSGYFEQLIRDVLLADRHCASVWLIPEIGLGEKKRAAEQLRLRELKNSLSASDIARVLREFEDLRQRQQTPDPPEVLATLPSLSPEDIPEKRYAEDVPPQLLLGVPVLKQPFDTEGIVYLDLFFRLADVCQDDLPEITAVSGLPVRIGTTGHTALELHSCIDATLGRIQFGTLAYAPISQPDEAQALLHINVAFLKTNKEAALELISEILNCTDYSDATAIRNLIRQNRIGMEESITMSGNSYALHRATAMLTVSGALSEALHGITLLRKLQSLENELEKEPERVIDRFSRWSRKLFTRDRLTLSLTGMEDDEWIGKLIKEIPEGEMGEPACYHTNPSIVEGYRIASDIGFAARVCRVEDSFGSGRVAAHILSYDYLWNEVRVKGGAYGTGHTVNPNGLNNFYSYRDPQPAASLRAFSQAPEALRRFCKENNNIDRYIIGAVAASDPLLTPRIEGTSAAIRYFSRITADYRSKMRERLVRTTIKDLKLLADRIDEGLDMAATCVIGGERTLSACEGILEHTELIQSGDDYS